MDLFDVGACPLGDLLGSLAHNSVGGRQSSGLDPVLQISRRIGVSAIGPRMPIDGPAHGLDATRHLEPGGAARLERGDDETCTAVRVGFNARACRLGRYLVGK